MNFSSPLTVLYNRETRVETCFERVPAPERFLLMDDVIYVIHELRRQSNYARSLTHSILINSFIKVGLNIFSPTSPAKYCFCLMDF